MINAISAPLKVKLVILIRLSSPSYQYFNTLINTTPTLLTHSLTHPLLTHPIITHSLSTHNLIVTHPLITHTHLTHPIRVSGPPAQLEKSRHTPSQHTSSHAQPIDIHTPSHTNPLIIHTPSPLLTHPINPPYQHRISGSPTQLYPKPNPINIPYQPTL